MRRGVVILGLGIALVASAGSFVASASPDGLNRVATDLGFAHRQETLYHAPLAGYTVPWVPGRASGGAAGLLGAGLVGGLAWGAGRLVAWRRSAAP